MTKPKDSQDVAFDSSPPENVFRDPIPQQDVAASPYGADWQPPQRPTYNIAIRTTQRIVENHLAGQREEPRRPAAPRLPAAPRRRSRRKESSWDTHCLALRKYKKKEGHTRVPCLFVTKDGVALGSWASKQRQEFKKKEKGMRHTLYPERLRQLNQIGFEWEVSTIRDQHSFQEQQEQTQVLCDSETAVGERLGIRENRHREHYPIVSTGSSQKLEESEEKELFEI